MIVTTNSTGIAVATLYAEHQPALLSYLQRLMGDFATAEDLCQETFLKALQGWERRDATHNAVAWLYRIARNTAYDALRHRRRIAFSSLADHELLAADKPTLELRVGEQEPVRLALARLAPRYREPLVLQHYAGYTLPEIAAAQGCSVAALKTRLHRARAQFQQVYRG